MWIPLRVDKTLRDFMGKLLCYFLKHPRETKFVKNLGIWQILELYIPSTLNPPWSLQMGPWENWQKPAKGENSSQNQLSYTNAYSTQKKKKI